MNTKLVSGSLRLIHSELRFALRATLVPLIASFIAAGWAQNALDDALTRWTLASIISMAGLSWAAVSWHRHVLLGERPAIVPVPPARAVGVYLLAVLRLAVLSVVPHGLIFLVLLSAGAISAGSYGIISTAAALLLILLVLGSVMFLVVLAYILMRLSLHLPAVAVGRPMGLRESWRRTAQARGTIAAGAILYAGAFPIAGSLLSDIGGGFAVLVVAWLAIMLPLSFMTALYAEIVQKQSVT